MIQKLLVISAGSHRQIRSLEKMQSCCVAILRYGSIHLFGWDTEKVLYMSLMTSDAIGKCKAGRRKIFFLILNSDVCLHPLVFANVLFFAYERA